MASLAWNVRTRQEAPPRAISRNSGRQLAPLLYVSNGKRLLTAQNNPQRSGAPQFRVHFTAQKTGPKNDPIIRKTKNSPLHLTGPIWLPSTDALSHRITDPTDPRLASSSTHDRADGGKITSRTMNYDKAYGVRRLSV